MKIYLSIPNTGTICSELTIKLIKWISESKHQIFYESSNEKPVEHNRNLIVQRFLKTDFDYLLMLDSDIVPQKNPIDLVDFKLDIISCPTWIYQYRLFLNVYKLNDEDDLEPFYIPEKDLIKIDASGTGCILISRKVLEKIKKPFERIYDENGLAILGQDISFSKKIREAGFDMYTHFDYICKHYKTIDLSLFT